MVDIKITEFVNYVTPLTTDVIPIIDLTNSQSKKVTVGNLSSVIASSLTGINATSIADGSVSNTEFQEMLQFKQQ
jgi:hypothetical protein